MEVIGNKRMNEKLEEYFRNEAAAFPGKVAYLYVDMSNYFIHFEKNSKDMVVSASMIKVPVMMCIFDLIRKGEFSLQTEIIVEENQILDDTHVFEYGLAKASLYELVVWMIVNSDNTATNVLLSFIGFDRLNDYFKKIGLLHTKLTRYMLDYQVIEECKNNWTSLWDFFQCMKQLREEECHNIYAGLAINVMKRNRDYDSLCRYLYEGPSVAHKSGGLDGIVHDAGVFETSEGSYFLGVFLSDFVPSSKMEQEAQKLIGRLSRKVYDFEELEIR